MKKHLFLIILTIALLNSINSYSQIIWGMAEGGGLYNKGVIFSYDVSKDVYIDIMDFDGKNGAYPGGSLIQAGNGMLYGLTAGGGKNNLGVIFEYDVISNNYNVLIELDSIKGYHPEGSLVEADNGKLYAMTYGGGKHDLGVFFEYDINTKTYRNIIDFDGKNGRGPEGSLIKAQNGRLYGMTYWGGGNDYSGIGVIFEYNPDDDLYTKLYVFNHNDGYWPGGDLLEVTEGELYGMTREGGIYRTSQIGGVIFKYNINTKTYTKLVDFDGNNGCYPEASLIQSSNGFLYGMTSKGGIGGVLFKYDAVNNIYTKLYVFDGKNGRIPAGTLMEASNNKFYGTTMFGGDYNTGVLFEFDPITNIYKKRFDFTDTSGTYPGRYPKHTQFIEPILPEFRVNILADKKNICAGTNVTFTAFTSTEYVLQSYQWIVNGKDAGSNSSIFSYQPIHEDTIRCILISNDEGETIKTAVSNAIIMRVISYPVNISISVSTNPICPGTEIIMTAIAENKGTQPSYQWKVNNKDAGSNDSIYIYSPSDKDTVKCILMSDKTCATQNPAASNEIIIYTISSYKADIRITASTTTLCAGESITLFADKVIGGEAPMFQWKVNGKNAGTNNSTFTYFPENNDRVKCVLTAADSCASANPATSNELLIKVTPGNYSLFGMTEFGGINHTGVIFKFDQLTKTYSKLYDFNGYNYNSLGSYPQASLMQAKDGKLYGMTWNCAPAPQYQGGVIFRFDPVDSAFKLLGGFDVAHSSCTLLQADDGNLYGLTQFEGYSNYGLLFEFDMREQMQKNLIEFDSINGAHPYGSLIQAYNRKLYGMTRSGGENQKGVLFEYDLKTKTYTKLLDFEENNGANPFGSLIELDNKKLYGHTANGGTNNDGVLFEYEPETKVFRKLYDFEGNTGKNPHASLLPATDGKFYGLTEKGGKNDKGVIFKFDIKDSVYTDIYDFNGEDGASPDGSLMQSHNGKLYGLTKNGGLYDYGVMFEFDPVDNVYTKLVDFTDTIGEFQGANPRYTSLLEVISPAVNIVTIATKNTIVCKGTSVTLKATSLDSTLASDYQWLVNGKDADNNNCNYTYVPERMDTVECILTSDNSCSVSNITTSNKLVVYVDSANIDFISENRSLLYPDFTAKFNNTSLNLDRYNFTWNFGDSTLLESNDTIVYHLYKKNGYYAVSLKALNKFTDCEDSLLMMDYILCSGLIDDIKSIDKQENNFGFVCFPNPASQTAVLSWQLAAKSNVNIKLYDVMGRVIVNVTDEEYQAGKHSIVLNLSDLEKGIYFIKMSVNDNTITKKLIKF